MNWSVLRNLLDKYYEGTSTAEEERKLIDILQREDLPEEFQDDRIILQGLFDSDEIPEPSSRLEAGILDAIDEFEKRGRLANTKTGLYSIVSIAASIIVILGLWFIIQNRTGLKDTYDDPQLAYNETVEVLQRVSRNLNLGRDQIKELSYITETKSRFKLIQDSRAQIEEDLDALRYIEKSIDMLGVNKNK